MFYFRINIRLLLSIFLLIIVVNTVSAKMIYQNLGGKDKIESPTLGEKIVKSNFEPKTALEVMKEQYSRGLQSPNFLYDYAYELKKQKENYVEVVNIYIAQLKKGKFNNPKNILFIYEFSDDLETNAMDVLLRHRNVFETKYGYAHIVNRIKSAALSNVEKAVKVKSEKLFKVVKQMIRKVNLVDEERMIFLIESTFYKDLTKWKEYFFVVKSYIQKHEVRHPQFLQEKAKDILTYSEEEEDLKVAKKWMETALIQERNYVFYDTYAHILFEMRHFKKAENVARKALTFSTPKNKNGLSSKTLIDQIQNFASGTTTTFNRPIKL
ncbi:MAG: hypothetical protein ACPG49_09410 [Chitinophagales bacterium]